MLSLLQICSVFSINSHNGLPETTSRSTIKYSHNRNTNANIIQNSLKICNILTICCSHLCLWPRTHFLARGTCQWNGEINIQQTQNRDKIKTCDLWTNEMEKKTFNKHRTEGQNYNLYTIVQNLYCERFFSHVPSFFGTFP